MQKDKNGKNLLNKLKELKDEEFEIKINGKTLILPSKKEWEQLKEDWKEKKNSNPDLDLKDFLEEYSIFKNQKCHQHQKVRKMFSLPIVTSEGHTLQKEGLGINKIFFRYGVMLTHVKIIISFSRLTLNQSGLREVVNKPFTSEKQFKLKIDHRKFFLKTDEYREFNPNQWYKINVPENLKECIEKLEYQIDNATRPKIKLTPKKQLSQEYIDKIQEEALTKPKDNKETQKLDKLKESCQSIEYTGSGFNKEVTEKLLKALNNKTGS